MSAASPTAPAVAHVSLSPLALLDTRSATLAARSTVSSSALLVGGALTPSPTAVTDSRPAPRRDTGFQSDGLQLAIPSRNGAARDDIRIG